jgi:type IV secretory pathway TrbD component
MLTSALRRLPPLSTLSPVSPARTEQGVDWDAPIDRTRWFFCETLTPLYYTPVYRDLDPRHRRRYNQLMGMLSNELILLLESRFLDLTLRALVPAAKDADPDLAVALQRFRDDERRHADGWRRLNRLSEPAWYADADRRLAHVPGLAAGLLSFVARHPVAMPVVLWMQLVQEERSVEISRRCLRMEPWRLEPRYAAAYRAHLADEIRHVRLDWHLIERCYAKRSRPVRRMTAAVFAALVRAFFLAPTGSTRRVIDELLAEFPELKPLRPRIARELRALAHDAGYHEMMYSRRSTPIAFALFDRFPEFHRMRHVLKSYVPADGGAP